MSPMRCAVVASLVLLGSAAGGCYADVGPPVYAEGNGPMYYDGYVVYYDDVGRPYYYANGSVVWVPPTAPVYVHLVDHWHRYREPYHRWYAHDGYRYRAYRRR